MFSVPGPKPKSHVSSRHRNVGNVGRSRSYHKLYAEREISQEKPRKWHGNEIVLQTIPSPLFDDNRLPFRISPSIRTNLRHFWCLSRACDSLPSILSKTHVPQLGIDPHEYGTYGVCDDHKLIR